MSPSSTGADALVGVLALQGDVREHETALRSCRVATRLVRLPQDLDGIDALVVPGGESTTMSNLALRWGLMEPLRELVRGGLPSYGSCAGMIMLGIRLVMQWSISHSIAETSGEQVITSPLSRRNFSASWNGSPL